jgi:hypothetical protein
MHFLLLIVTFCTIAFGSNPSTYRVDTSSSNLVATFPNSAQLSGPLTAFSVVQVFNGSGSEIEVNCSQATKPSSNASNSFYVPASMGFQTVSSVPSGSTAIKYPLSNVCWMRSVSGTISSGIIQIIGWGN